MRRKGGREREIPHRRKERKEGRKGGRKEGRRETRAAKEGRIREAWINIGPFLVKNKVV